MADVRDDEVAGVLNPTRLAAAAMTVGGVLLAVVAAVWAVARFHELSQESGPKVTDFAATAALLLAAWAFGLLLWGGAELLRHLEELNSVLRETGESREAAQASGRPMPRGVSSLDTQVRLLEQLVLLTRDTRDIALLTDAQRAARSQSEGQTLAQHLERDVPALLREHNWQEAHRRVHQARARFPELPAWTGLAEQVEQARAKFEAHDIETAEREIGDLIALTEWERAAVVVRELQHRHPNAERVIELVRRVEAGLDRSVAEERARLMAQAQEATTERRWSDALRLVEVVMERFPKSAEARELRLQLPTLRANVEIQVRQQMEMEIRDLIREHHYAEALRRARRLIELYPDSPQAAVLREQLPRLQEKVG